jgi:glycosyltransferase involved in cell wall biosynthesis
MEAFVPVSVILPVFNGARFLGAAVRSVLEQTQRPSEIIVVDDGSTDATAQIVAELATDCVIPIRYIFQANRGPAAARNAGIQQASGQFLAFQDADDLWLETKLARQYELMVNSPGTEVVLGYVQLVRQSDTGFAAFGNAGPMTVLQAALFRRSAFERAGLLDANLRQGEDLDWYLRAIEQDVSILVHPDVVLLYRRHENNLTRGAGVSPHVLAQLRQSVARRRQRESHIAETP